MIHPWILQLVALGPVLWWFAMRLDDGSDEPLGLLTLVAALLIAWRERKSLAASTFWRSCGCALILLSVLGIYGFPPMIRAALAVGGVAIFHGLHRLPGVTGLLMLSLPVAASMQFYLGYPLRVAAAEGAVRILELGSLVVSRQGTQIDLGGQIIGVDPACAGVRMLWHALAAAMGLAALHRLRWRATIVGGFLAVALVVPANAVRAALLAVKESGHWRDMPLGHEMIGLIGFGIILVPLWLAISTRARPASPQRTSARMGRISWVLLILAAVLSPVLSQSNRLTPELPLPGDTPSNFTFNGLTLPLDRLPRTDEEIAFAGSFPGTLASFRWGKDQVILRTVGEATRRLHPSRDCLRAAGYSTGESLTVTLADGSVWSKFDAMRDGLRWSVHERVTSGRNGQSWTDVSAWYWSALFHPLNGPWQAETVISTP